MVNALTDNTNGSCPPPKRNRARRLSVALIAALSLLAFGASSAAAAVPSTFFGITAVRPSTADYKGMANKIGAGSFRVEIGWPSVQPSKGHAFVFGGLDGRFKEAASHGMRPVPVLFGTPKWVSKSDAITPPVKNKSQQKKWQAFVRAAAKRYGPGGDFWTDNPGLDGNLAPKNWIIWNEQNARAYWNPAANPKKYAKLLRITRSAFDDVDPGLLITVGGMFGYPENSNSIPAKKFLRELYRAKGAKHLIDAVSLHPYGGNVGAVKQQVANARHVMDKAGDRRAKLIIGEIGWASGGSPKDYFLIKNKIGQEKLLKQSYKMLLKKRKEWGITSAYWFTYRDYGGEKVCNWCPKAGLLDKKGKLKPAGEAYRRLVRANVG